VRDGSERIAAHAASGSNPGVIGCSRPFAEDLRFAAS
jgi:hypothetical protein